MKLGMGLVIALAALGTARAARVLSRAESQATIVDEPYAPSPGAAPFVSLGYREAVADLLWVRMVGYFGGDDSTADGVGALAEAVIALDPHYHRVYEFGARAMTIAHEGVTQATYMHSLDILARGATVFPQDWKLPYLAGLIYTQDLVTKDPAERRKWDEAGAQLLETAIRKPKAPPGVATWAASMRTRLGQRQQAIDGLREMILLTADPASQGRLIKKLAELEKSDAADVAAEMLEARRRFTDDWLANRPAITQSFYILVGPRPPAAFDMADLATGGRDLVEAKPIERLEPIE